MTYGLIGNPLSHSYSKELHALMSSDPYDLVELQPDELSRFFAERKFSAVNVTIPYKQAVIPYLDELDGSAKEIGSVNTVVNRTGKLVGFNTDVYGLKRLIQKYFPSLSGKTVLVLGGDGGTARAAVAVAKQLGAASVFAVSRRPTGGMISYERAAKTDAQVLIHATPVGMFPKTDARPISLSSFSHLELVIDAVYNPLRSHLILDAQKRRIPAEGGLYMLTEQAVRARELFIGQPLPDGTGEKIYRKLLQAKENLVLIGMPSCGKTTVGSALAKALGKPFFDLDEEIERIEKRKISDLFASYGEAGFRRLETETVKKLTANVRGAVIATGGGTPLFEGNERSLAENGRLIFLDRSLENLTPTETRPLSSDRNRLALLYRERYEKYGSIADMRVKNDGNIADTVRKIMEEWI